MRFPRQEYWSGLPFPSPGNLPEPRDQTWVPHIAGRLFTVWTAREAPKVLCLSFLHTEFLLITQIVGIPLPNTFSGFPTTRSLIHKVLNLICKASMLQHSYHLRSFSPSLHSCFQPPFSSSNQTKLFNTSRPWNILVCLHWIWQLFILWVSRHVLRKFFPMLSPQHPFPYRILSFFHSTYHSV